MKLAIRSTNEKIEICDHEFLVSESSFRTFTEINFSFLRYIDRRSNVRRGASSIDSQRVKGVEKFPKRMLLKAQLKNQTLFALIYL